MLKKKKPFIIIREDDLYLFNILKRIYKIFKRPSKKSIEIPKMEYKV